MQPRPRRPERSPTGPARVTNRRLTRSGGQSRRAVVLSRPPPPAIQERGAAGAAAPPHPGTRQSLSGRPRFPRPLLRTRPIRARRPGPAEIFKSTPRKSCFSKRHEGAGARDGSARPRSQSRGEAGHGRPVGTPPPYQRPRRAWPTAIC